MLLFILSVGTGCRNDRMELPPGDDGVFSNNRHGRYIQMRLRVKKVHPNLN